MKIVDILLEYPTLQLGFNYILKNNKSNLAPYHNLNHMLCVVKYCYHALEFMNMLSDENSESLLLAALFHDFNHSMGRRDDSFNVREAKSGFDNFCKTTIIDINKDLIHNIIDATEYPYVIENKDLNIYQAIIRDADLMQILESDWITHVILGLCEEMHYPLKELMVGEKVFLKNMKFHSPYGKMMQQKFGKQVWEDFKKLEELLK